MFYYLHFTRAPPEQSILTQPVIITPSVANDLRTEHPTVPIDIYYAWIKCLHNPHSGSGSSSDIASSPEGASRRVIGPMTRPQKLCTWTGNAYKEVQVFPPKEAHPNEYWQLLLCSSSTSLSSTPRKPPRAQNPILSVDLSLPLHDFGVETVFPIVSSPILFSTRKDQKNEKKQVRNERILKLPPLWSNGPVGPLRLMEHLSFDLDKKVWDSGLGLANWLITTMTDSANIPSELRSVIDKDSPKIIELGTGTGLVSLILSTLLELYPAKPKAKIIATDLESAMEILGTNINNNKHLYPSINLEPNVLDWEEEELPQNVQDGVDFIIMADVTYNTASFPALISTLKRLHKASRSQRLVRKDCSATEGSRPIVLLAYKERHVDERKLWSLAAEIGLKFSDIGRIPGAGGNPIEIFAGSFDETFKAITYEE